MKIFFNYIFYVVYWWNNKIMKISGFTNPSYFPSCVIIGLLISMYFFIFFDIIGICFNMNLLWSNYTFSIFIPLIFTIIVCFFYSYNKNYKKAIKSILRMNISKRKKVKVYSFIHIFLILTLFFIMGDIIREIKHNDAPSYIKYFEKLFNF
jgi:hypothetical protein